MTQLINYVRHSWIYSILLLRKLILFFETQNNWKDELELLEIDENCIIGSQGIKSMIPLKQTLELMLKQLKEDESLKDRTTWSPKHAQIVNLLKIWLETYFKTYDGQMYMQTDGTWLENQSQDHWLEYLSKKWEIQSPNYFLETYEECHLCCMENQQEYHYWWV